MSRFFFLVFLGVVLGGMFLLSCYGKNDSDDSSEIIASTTTTTISEDNVNWDCTPCKGTLERATDIIEDNQNCCESDGCKICFSSAGDLATDGYHYEKTEYSSGARMKSEAIMDDAYHAHANMNLYCANGQNCTSAYLEINNETRIANATLYAGSYTFLYTYSLDDNIEHWTCPDGTSWTPCGDGTDWYYGSNLPESGDNCPDESTLPACEW